MRKEPERKALGFESPKSPAGVSLLLAGLLIVFVCLVSTVSAQRAPDIVVTDVSGSIYASAWEIEKEILVRPLTIQDGFGVHLGIATGDLVNGADRMSWKDDILEGLEDTLTVWIDGDARTFQPVGVQFILPDPKKFKPLLPEQEISVDEFMISVTWAAPLPELTSKVEVEWSSFPQQVEVVPLRLADTMGTRTIYLQRRVGKIDAQVTLAANLRKIPRLNHKPVSYTKKRGWMFLAPMAFFFAVGVRYVWLREKAKAVICLLVCAGIGLSVLPLLGARHYPVTHESVSERLGLILERVYYAYQFTDRDRQYQAMQDALAGQALESSFLKAQKTLGLRDRQGTRVRVRSVVLEDVRLDDLGGGKVLVDAYWTTSGELGHWGHFHRVKHFHSAVVSLEVVDARWKATEFKIKERRTVK